MQVNNCAYCKRDFIPNKCEVHCTNNCCIRHGCENKRRDPRAPREVETKCMVCHRPASTFEKFAPCTRACKGAIYFQSSKGDPGTMGATFARRWVTDCHLRETLPTPDWHQPALPPRVHVKYCSLRCYNSFAFGHETRRLDGNRKRRRNYEANSGEVPGWRNRWRTETGYFRDYQREKKRRQDNMLRFGDDRSEKELRDAEQLRNAALGDPDFMEIFGKGSLE